MERFNLKHSWIIGIGIWVLFVLVKNIPAPQQLEWIQVLLVFAPLVIIPFGLQLAFSSQMIYLNVRFTDSY